jgi:hypothetical protein
MTKMIVLFIKRFTRRLTVFIRQLNYQIKYLNRTVYKTKFLKFLKFIFLIKFKTYEKRGKVKPRKKKAHLKKGLKYFF